MLIDIHTHGSVPLPGVVSIENITLGDISRNDNFDRLFSAGIHPWYLDEDNAKPLLTELESLAKHPNLIAVGECGFDKNKGASHLLQSEAFNLQIELAEDYDKPVIIHSVRSWGALMDAHKRLKPQTPWMVHGFRGKPDLARQLSARGIYLSPWAPYLMEEDAELLLKSIPQDHLLIETDGFGVSLGTIYREVSVKLGIEQSLLEEIIVINTLRFTGLTTEKLESFIGR